MLVRGRVIILLRFERAPSFARTGGIDITGTIGTGWNTLRQDNR